MDDQVASTVNNSTAVLVEDNIPKKVTTFDKALMGCYVDTTGNILGKMNGHHDELEERKINMILLNKISARIATLTDEMGVLKVSPSENLTELVGWLREAQTDLHVDFGDLDAFLAAPNPISTQTLAGNVRSAVDEQKMHVELGLTRSSTLQQQFNLIVTIINEVIKKHDRCKDRPASAIHRG